MVCNKLQIGWAERGDENESGVGDGGGGKKLRIEKTNNYEVTITQGRATLFSCVGHPCFGFPVKPRLRLKSAAAAVTMAANSGMRSFGKRTVAAVMPMAAATVPSDE